MNHARERKRERKRANNFRLSCKQKIQMIAMCVRSASVFRQHTKRMRNGFCIVWVSCPIFYFIFSNHRVAYFGCIVFELSLFHVSLPTFFIRGARFVSETLWFFVSGASKANERDTTKNWKQERVFFIMHGSAIQCDCGFLFAANKTHYSHILCVIFIECVWVSATSVVSFPKNKTEK